MRAIAELYQQAECKAVNYKQIIVVQPSFKREAKHIIRLAEKSGYNVIIHLERRSQKDEDNIAAFMSSRYPENVWVGTLKREFQGRHDDAVPTLVMHSDTSYYLRESAFTQHDTLSAHNMFGTINPAQHYSMCKEIRQFRMNNDELTISYAGASEIYAHRLSPYDTNYAGSRATRLKQIRHMEVTFCEHQNFTANAIAQQR